MLDTTEPCERQRGRADVQHGESAHGAYGSEHTQLLHIMESDLVDAGRPRRFDLLRQSLDNSHGVSVQLEPPTPHAFAAGQHTSPYTETDEAIKVDARESEDDRTPVPGAQSSSTPRSTERLTVQRKSSQGKKSKEEGFVKRPLNSFMLYRKDYQHKIPTNNHQSISKIIGDMWRKETAEVKNHYDELAKVERDRHLLANPGYKFQPRKKKDKAHRTSSKSNRKGPYDSGDETSHYGSPNVHQQPFHLSRSVSENSFYTASSVASSYNSYSQHGTDYSLMQPHTEPYHEIPIRLDHEPRLNPETWQFHYAEGSAEQGTQEENGYSMVDYDAMKYAHYGYPVDQYIEYQQYPEYIDPEMMHIMNNEYIATTGFEQGLIHGSWEVQE